MINAGGFVSLGLNQGGRNNTRDYDSSEAVAFNCGRSSQAFAQVYLYATKELNLSAVGFGSDINGFAGSIAPRYGSKACTGDMPGSYDPDSAAGRLDYGDGDELFRRAIVAIHLRQPHVGFQRPRLRTCRPVSRLSRRPEGDRLVGRGA